MSMPLAEPDATSTTDDPDHRYPSSLPAPITTGPHRYRPR
jgi:hypothetical protein